MTLTDDIKTLLAADSTLSTPLTGGLYTFEETKRLGISKQTTPSAFNTQTGILKPCLLVKGRDPVPDGAISDLAAQYASFKQVVEIWVYNDGDAGYSVINTAIARIYVLLHGKRVSLVPLRWVNGLREQRDAALQYACFARDDFLALSVRRP